MHYILTNRGLEWMAKVNAGNPLQLTRAAAGSGYSPFPADLTMLIDKKQDIQIDAVATEGDEAIIHCVLSNLELLLPYTVNQIGIYAMDTIQNEEILLIIGQDEQGDWIPAISDSEVEYLYHIAIKVSNASTITFNCNVNDFVRKSCCQEQRDQYDKALWDLWQRIQELQKEIDKLKEPTIAPGGCLFIGGEHTPIVNNEVILITSTAHDKIVGGGGMLYLGSKDQEVNETGVMLIISEKVSGLHGGLVYAGSQNHPIRSSSILFIIEDSTSSV